MQGPHRPRDDRKPTRRCPGVGTSGRSRDGHDRPHGRPPRCRLGREGSAFAGCVGVKPRGVEPVGGARLPPGIIKSTVK